MLQRGGEYLPLGRQSGRARYASSCKRPTRAGLEHVAHGFTDRMISEVGGRSGFDDRPGPGQERLQGIVGRDVMKPPYCLNSPDKSVETVDSRCSSMHGPVRLGPLVDMYVFALASYYSLIVISRVSDLTDPFWWLRARCDL